MNEGIVQSSPVQKVVAGGDPKLWGINNTQLLSQNQHHSFLAAPPQNDFPHQLIMSPLVPPAAYSWTDCQELLPESWGQLLLGGLVVEEEYKAGKKLEKWEQHYHLLNQISTASTASVIKQDDINAINVEFQLAAKSTNCWSSPQILSASSPISCITTLSTNMLDFSHKSSACHSTATGGAAKKARIQTSSSPQSAIKVRREKLGDRITALQQLVSPFGKTDTASVLLETIGYIRFLQSQIETLSVPYFDTTSSADISRHQHECDEKPKKDLQSRGLCLVPVSCCTVEVGSLGNRANYWAPARFAPNFQ